MSAFQACTALYRINHPEASINERQLSTVASTLIGARRLDQLTANLAALDVTPTAEQIATLDAVSKPPLSFPAGYAQISQMFGFPGTKVDGVRMPPSPMLATSTARY
jgi:hypothetical protein